MVVECMTLRLHLHGCRSLKEKRRRVSGLRDRFGRRPNLAVSEISHHDSHLESEWGFIAVAGDRTITSSLLDDVLSWASQSLDAAIVGNERQDLPVAPTRTWIG